MEVGDIGDLRRDRAGNGVVSRREVHEGPEVAHVVGEGSDEAEVRDVECSHVPPRGIARDPLPRAKVGGEVPRRQGGLRVVGDSCFNGEQGTVFGHPRRPCGGGTAEVEVEDEK